MLYFHHLQVLNTFEEGTLCFRLALSPINYVACLGLSLPTSVRRCWTKGPEELRVPFQLMAEAGGPPEGPLWGLHMAISPQEVTDELPDVNTSRRSHLSSEVACAQDLGDTRLSLFTHPSSFATCLSLRYSMCGPWTSSLGIAWELVRSADSRASLQTEGAMCVFTGSRVILRHHKV